MLRCKFQLLISFVLCHVIVDSENSTLVISNKRVTWIEGQKQCAEKNGRLLSSDDFSLYLQEDLEKVSGDVWLGDIKKVSDWIHILGCYSKASIENDLSSPTNFTIALTPGRCQEHCFNEKMSLFFAIKEETCFCLKSDFKLPNTASVSKCDYSCNSEEPKACGSKTGQYLSVYKTTNTSEDRNTLCMTIQCSDEKYIPEGCQNSQNPYCSINITVTAGSWDVGNDMCLKENGYLDGDANLDYPRRKCNEIKVRFPNTYVFWIGIRRQVYKTADKGYPMESDSLKECEFFPKGNLEAMQTNDCNKKYYAVCLVPYNNGSMTNADQPTGDKRENNVPDDIGPVVGGVFGGLFLIAGVFLLTIIVIRRQRKGKKEDQSTLKFESEPPTSISELKVNQSNDNGFSRYPEMNNTDTKEETYYKSQDDYDILGKRRSKLKGAQSENIYNHAESSTNQNYYASAAQVSKRISGEDLYDHTSNSEYGTVSEMDNDNMYSES